MSRSSKDLASLTLPRGEEEAQKASYAAAGGVEILRDFRRQWKEKKAGTGLATNPVGKR
jgi:hypothetical protein